MRVKTPCPSLHGDGHLRTNQTMACWNRPTPRSQLKGALECGAAACYPRPLRTSSFSLQPYAQGHLQSGAALRTRKKLFRSPCPGPPTPRPQFSALHFGTNLISAPLIIPPLPLIAACGAGTPRLLYKARRARTVATLARAPSLLRPRRPPPLPLSTTPLPTLVTHTRCRSTS